METDRSTPENPDQMTSDDQEQAAAYASPVRSYDCIFCKRGFSNAQALGGHMNIHRKDKAKLKQTSSNNQNKQSFNIMKIRPSHSFPIRTNTHIQPPSIEVRASQEIIRSTTKRPWIPGEENDATNTDKNHVREVRQLHLFVEKPASSDQSPGIQVHGNTEKVSSSSSSSGSELDLELRLGHEPQESTSATGTKKFF